MTQVVAPVIDAGVRGGVASFLDALHALACTAVDDGAAWETADMDTQRLRALARQTDYPDASYRSLFAELARECAMQPTAELFASRLEALARSDLVSGPAYTRPDSPAIHLPSPTGGYGKYSRKPATFAAMLVVSLARACDALWRALQAMDIATETRLDAYATLDRYQRLHKRVERAQSHAWTALAAYNPATGQAGRNVGRGRGARTPDEKRELDRYHARRAGRPTGYRHH